MCSGSVLAAPLRAHIIIILFPTGRYGRVLLRKASAARVDRRLRRYYLIVRLLPNVFALACLSLSSI